MAVEILPDLEASAESHVAQKRLPHLLVVDDENGPRQALRVLLEEDYVVHLCDDPTCALDALREHPIEVVISDVRMPKKTGVDLLREIKEVDEDIQVIIFTGFGELETAMKAVEYGAFAYIEKPFDNDTMVDTVHSAQQKYRRERDRRVFEQLALEANRFATLGRLVSGTMHDLGTPLTVIGSHVELMLMVPDKDDVPKRLETIKQQVKFCADMTKATMDYLRTNGGPDSLVNMNDVIKACVAVSKPLMREHQVDIQLELDEGLPATRGEAVLLRQSVMNLMNNACHAMEETDTPRTLTLRTACEDGDVVVQVQDSGPGVPAHLRASIFDTFFTTKGQSGTGLGLGVVKHVVERSNGSVALEDNGEPGACFTLRLPSAD